MNENPGCAKARQAWQEIDRFVRVSGPSDAAAVLERLRRFLRFAGTIAGVMRLFRPKRPKIDPLMSQPYSPTGKRFIRPIVGRILWDPPKPQEQIDAELEARQAHDHNRAEIRRIVVALGLWIALLLMAHRLIVEHLAAAHKVLAP